MNRILMKLLVVAVPLLLFSIQAAADVSVSATFSKGEISIIAQWYSDHPNTSVRGGGGKKKPKGLPPGIAKNLARGKPLPPGIAKQVLPQGLIALLPPAPKGFERIVVDGKVLLVEVATRVIHDILVDVILR
jgi:hypothetical protein